MPLRKLYTLRMLTQLNREALNGIRGTYYSPTVTKTGNIPQIDKSIKVEELKATDFGKMLQALGYYKVAVYVKPTALSRETNLDEVESFLDQLNTLASIQTTQKDSPNKNEEEQLVIREKALEDRETKIVEREKDLSEKENSLNEKIKLLSGGEKEYDERITILLQNESYLNQKKAELEEKENILQQKESELNQLKKEYDKRENELNQKETALKNNTPNVDSNSIRENDLPPLEDVERSQQVTGIELRQSERNRILSDDPERSRLIEEAGKEICNKWLTTKSNLLKENGKTTEKLIYRFVQDFIKSNYPYCGQAVYDLVLYDLQKRRKEMNE